MSATPKLTFRRLEDPERELAGELAASAAGWNVPYVERFGRLDGRTPPAGEPWGLFIKGSLCGLAWFVPPVGGGAEVAALLVAKNWWRTGLAAWMLEELAKAAGQAGAGEIVVRLAGDGAAAGEILVDAGFSGPDPEDETYPDGEWRRSTRLAGSLERSR